MSTPTSREVLSLALPENDANAATIGDYLTALLLGVWMDRECFDGKRPFGNSSWEYELYVPLVKAGWVPGSFDEDGDLADCDSAAADKLIDDAIHWLGAVSA